MPTADDDKKRLEREAEQQRKEQERRDAENRRAERREHDNLNVDADGNIVDPTKAVDNDRLGDVKQEGRAAADAALERPNIIKEKARMSAEAAASAGIDRTPDEQDVDEAGENPSRQAAAQNAAEVKERNQERKEAGDPSVSPQLPHQKRP